MTFAQLVVAGAAAAALLQTLMVLPRLRTLPKRGWAALAVNWATPPLLYLAFLLVPSIGSMPVF